LALNKRRSGAGLGRLGFNASRPAFFWKMSEEEFLSQILKALEPVA